MITKKEELEAELTRLNALRKQVKEKLKALPIYELNRWYKHPNGSLYFINNECEYGHLYGYGFDNDGEWYVRNNDESDFCAFNSVAKKEITEAAPQEVEQAMIEESNRIYKENVRVKCAFHNVESIVYDFNSFVFVDNNLWSKSDFGNICLFSNGKWATIIEQDKFAELKEAHRNGAVIELWSSFLDKWFVVKEDKDLWLPTYEYRIKPEEKPKVGDVCKFWDLIEKDYTIGNFKGLINIDGKDFYRRTNCHSYYQNAKPLTQQEAINLLFNKGAN